MISKILLQICVFIFFLQFAIGPLPVFVAGIYLDNIVSGAFLLCIIILNLTKPIRYSNFLFIILIFYFTLLAPSVLFSINQKDSSIAFIVSILYSFLFFLVVCRKYSMEDYEWLCKSAIFSVFIISCLIIYLYNNFSIGDDARFFISLNYNEFVPGDHSVSQAVDPNMTAMSLVMLFAFSLPGIIEGSHKGVKLFGCLIAFPLLVVAIAILQSRTSLVQLSIITAMFVLHIKTKLIWKFLIVVALVGVVVGLVTTEGGLLTHIFERIFTSGENDAGEGGRIMLIRSYFAQYALNISTLIFGIGYFSTNPHNEYLRNFFDSGMLGGMAFLIFMGFSILGIIRRAEIFNQHKNYIFMVLGPYLFMLGTYGHTKTFWVGLAFCMIISRMDLRKKVFFNHVKAM